MQAVPVYTLPEGLTEYAHIQQEIHERIFRASYTKLIAPEIFEGENLGVIFRHTNFVLFFASLLGSGAHARNSMEMNHQLSKYLRLTSDGNTYVFPQLQAITDVFNNKPERKRLYPFFVPAVPEEHIVYVSPAVGEPGARYTNADVVVMGCSRFILNERTDRLSTIAFLNNRIVGTQYVVSEVLGQLSDIL